MTNKELSKRLQISLIKFWHIFLCIEVINHWHLGDWFLVYFRNMGNATSKVKLHFIYHQPESINSLKKEKDLMKKSFVFCHTIWYAAKFNSRSTNKVRYTFQMLRSLLFNMCLLSKVLKTITIFLILCLLKFNWITIASLKCIRKCQSRNSLLFLLWIIYTF